MTLGEWDYVIRGEGLTDEDLLRFAYYVAQRGNIRTSTLCARGATFLTDVEVLDARLADVEARKYAVP